jgi:hypothetical protein
MDEKKNNIKLTTKQIFYIVCGIVSFLVMLVSLGGVVMLTDRIVRVPGWGGYYYEQSFGELKAYYANYNDNGDITSYILSDEQIREEIALKEERNKKSEEEDRRSDRSRGINSLMFVAPIFVVSLFSFLYFDAKLEERGWVAKRLKKDKK